MRKSIGTDLHNLRTGRTGNERFIVNTVVDQSGPGARCPLRHSPLPLNSAGEEDKMRKLMGWAEDRKIAYQLLCGQNRLNT